MTETPLHWLTISELAQRIRRGALSPVELTEHMLSRLEALDGTLTLSNSWRVSVPWPRHRLRSWP